MFAQSPSRVNQAATAPVLGYTRPVIPSHTWQLLTKAAERIEPDAFAKYFTLRDLLASGRRKDRDAFRKLFTSYYRLQIGGLTEAFKDRYFELLFDCSPKGRKDPYTPLLLELYKFPRRQHDQTLQGSFVTKLVSIHDESRPIYDRHVSDFFGLRVPSIGPTAFRIAGFVANLAHIQKHYEDWEADRRFRGLQAALVRKQPRMEKCHPNRVCDFLVWTIGANRNTLRHQ